MKQVIYYHQSLPLYDYRFSLKGHNVRSNLFYYYIYPLYVRLFLNEKSYIAVQTENIKDRFSERYKFSKDKIDVFFPEFEKIDAESITPYFFEKGTYNFVYPSMGATYKEHMTIVNALQCIYGDNPEFAKRIRIHFSILESDNKELYNYICQNHQQVNFIFHGNIPHQQVLSMLKNSEGLLFPSVIETLGLPLLEAAALGVKVVANDLGYAREVLAGYEGVDFVKVHDYEGWAKIIRKCCEKKYHFQTYNHPSDDSWGRLILQIQKMADNNKTICVLATASAKRGALAIYNQFVRALANQDKNEDWHIFVDYDMPMPEISHVYYHRCHTKGFGRVWFDFVGFRSMIKSLGIKPDVLFSLQNTGVIC